MEPFRSSIPVELLYPEVGGTERFHTNAAASTVQHTVFHKLNECLDNAGAMEPFRSMFEPELLQEDPDDHEENGSAITDGRSRTESDGRVSPTSSTHSTDHSSWSNNLSHSRKSSWATSIDSFQEHEKAPQLPVDGTHVLATSNEVDMGSTFLSEYQHYHDLISKESTAFHGTTSKADSDHIEVLHEVMEEPQYTARPDEADTDDSGSEYSAQDETATDEHDVANHFTEEMPHIIEESFAADDSSLYEDDSAILPPASPEEAAAWAHSNCPTDPNGTKLKILTDHNGLEYVLYRDCFHCLPKALAPEFTVGAVCDDGDSNGDEHHEDSSEQEPEENIGEDGDGKGSAEEDHG
ncbi:hypothetical protein VPNG_07266 [Cytospora leucostoma]|uniref:Uncharacterized protein n=1 Tax=Cytospora leucostoma TaxID=1230097 RepID=A0A423WKI1_9PEZI|nr:hypothetical protein VPNG_07266 [Cytospora leucostoma]